MRLQKILKKLFTAKQFCLIPKKPTLILYLLKKNKKYYFDILN